MFGALEALDQERVLLPWLAEAVTIDQERLRLAHGSVKVDYVYWPRLSPASGNGQVEPDVLLTIQPLGDSASEVVVVLIEAKYESGPSGWPTGPDVDDMTGQLGRQWAALANLEPWLAPGKPIRIDRRIIVYLTADVTIPGTTMAEMIGEVAKHELQPDEFRRSLYWLSWRALSGIVTAQADDSILLRRLGDILSARGLCNFRGCSPPTVPPLPWSYHAGGGEPQ